MKKILLLALTFAVLLSSCSSSHVDIWDTLRGVVDLAEITFEVTEIHLEMIETNSESIATLSGAIESLSRSIVSINDSMMILIARIEALEKR